PVRVESRPGARFLAFRIRMPARAPVWRRSALARRPAGARWHSRCVAASSMQLSRFVVAYRDIRPGEHVLYSVLADHYVGIDDATSDALERWTRGRRPADAAE